MKTVGIQPHEFRPDRELVTLVLQALKRNCFIQANTIQVGLTQGWVTLMGEVDCASQRQLAEATVRAVDGVIGVTNRIVIRPRTPQVYAASGDADMDVVTRSFSLPGAVKLDKAGAEFKDGLLTISLPKSEVVKPRQIKIAANGGK